MPVLLLAEGFRCFFFSNEGLEPAHVHVEKGDGYAKFWLVPEVVLAESAGLKSQELKRARILVTEHRTTFLEKWREYFDS